MLLIDTVKEYLDQANIINDYVYLLDFDESQYKDDYVFVMLQQPTTSDIHSIDMDIEVNLITPHQKNGSVTKILTDATNLRQFIFENHKYNCIINNTDILSEVAGPFNTDSGRKVYRFNFRVATTPQKIYG